MAALTIETSSPAFNNLMFDQAFLEAAQLPAEHFRQLLDSLPAAIYTTDAAGWITFYNQAAVELSVASRG